MPRCVEFSFIILYCGLSYTVLEKRMIVNYEKGKVWKKAVMSYFKLLSQHLPGKIEKHHKKGSG